MSEVPLYSCTKLTPGLRRLPHTRTPVQRIWYIYDSMSSEYGAYKTVKARC